jgi:hypothetical protein
MFTTLFFSMSLVLQSGIVAESHPLDLVETMYEQQAREEALQRAFQRSSETTQEHIFEQRFNDVAKALAAFGETWNQSHRIDKRKSERLRKAWRDLGKTDAWFNTSPPEK